MKKAKDKNQQPETLTQVVIKKLNRIKDIMVELTYFSNYYEEFVKENQKEKFAKI